MSVIRHIINYWNPLFFIMVAGFTVCCNTPETSIREHVAPAVAINGIAHARTFLDPHLNSWPICKVVQSDTDMHE
jgi:hypothetical protein